MKRKFLQKCAVTAMALLMLSTALPVPAAAAGHFPDVPEEHWAYDEIQQAVAQGLFQGQKDGTFGVGQPLTRASFVTVLCRLFGWEMIAPDTPSYSDVAKNSWCYSSVETAKANGAISGHLTAFQPNEAMTREEMISMLVRALGYEELAGLAQELELSFTDLTSNVGYVSVGYRLGLMSGFDATTFSPNGVVTREQAAVVLTRLHNKYIHSYPDTVSAVWKGGDFLDANKSSDVVILPGVQMYSNAMKDADIVKETVEDVHEAGAKALMRVELTNSAIPANLTTTVNAKKVAEKIRALIDTMKANGYDGIQLEMPNITARQKDTFSSFAKALRDEMPEAALLYVAVDAPVWQGDSPEGYDYAALGKSADCLVLRLKSYKKINNGFPMAPYEPLEEVYYALSAVTEDVAPEKISIQLTTTGSVWTHTSRSSHEEGVITGAEVQQMLTDGAQRCWAGRYESPYLIKEEKNNSLVVWYLDREAVDCRLDLARFFGVTKVMLSDLAGLAVGEACISAALWE